MKLALFADIHSNLEAITACIAHAQALGADRYAFLGDLVGYGADPVAVLDLIEQHAANGAVVVLGNHDAAALGRPDDTLNSNARAAIDWTQTQLGEKQRAFLEDPSPEAYRKVVDDLLSRPQYGERWARHWLDVVRYAESNGYERDDPKPHAWRYRDYVINAFNNDKPFDRFLTEQIAGDEVGGSNAETQIATTFLRLGTWDDEPAEFTMDRYDQLDDVLKTVVSY